MRKPANVPVSPSAHTYQELNSIFPSLPSRRLGGPRKMLSTSRGHWCLSVCSSKRHTVERISRHLVLFTFLCIAIHTVVWNFQPYVTFMHEEAVDLHPMEDILPEPVHVVPETLARYVQWHRVQRACIVNPSACKQPFQRPSILIWRCPDRDVRVCAGIGDRVRGMQVALLIAILTRRLFFIQWPMDEYPLHHAFAPNVIDWRIPPSITHGATANNWPMLNWFICNYPQRRTQCRPPNFLVPKDDYLPNVNSSLPMLNASIDDVVGNLSVVTDINVACRLPVSVIDALLSNAFIAPTVPDLQAQLLPSLQLQRLLTTMLFRPSVSTTAVISRTLTSDFFSSRGYVGAHGRTGVAFRENGDRFEFYRQNMTAAVTHLLTCTRDVDSDGTTNVFLSSDSATFKREFATQAQSLNINVRFIDANAFHFGLDDSDKMFVEQGQLARYNAFIDIFADLFMLAGAKQIVTTGSGFANLAFWLGNASRMVVAPPENGSAICEEARIQTHDGLQQPLILEW